MPRSRPLLACLVFAITFLTFARLTNCNFTFWDDDKTIRQNHWLNPPTWGTLSYYWTTASESDTMGLYVPVTYTVWSALAKMARLDHPDSEGLMLNPVVFHMANVLLHGMTAVMVFWLLMSVFERRTKLPAEAETQAGRDVLPAFFGALVFALHPVQVETVGWVSGTKDLLCGLLSVIALLMYVRSRYWMGMLFFVLAMLSKPTAVVLPLMAGVIGVLLLDRPLRRTVIVLIPWGLLMIPCMVLTREVQPAAWASSVPVWARPAVAADAVAFYLVKLVWPAHLCIDYGRNTAAIVEHHLIYWTWILPVGIAGLIGWRYRSRIVIAGGLLFLLPLIPVLGFVPFEFELISTTADHYLYLPMLGIAVVVMWILIRVESRRSKWVCAAILLVMGTRSILQEPVWHDSRSLFLHALWINPRSIVSFDGLGFVTGRDARRLSDQGLVEQARALFEQSIWYYTKSLEYDPGSVDSMVNLALDDEKVDLAREQINQIVKLQKKLPAGLHADPIYLAHLLIDARDIPHAIQWLDEVIYADPRNFSAVVLRQQAMDQIRSATK